ncbi:MAG: hypothetical protein WDN28_07410 [Chthoniobacter sp.]
MTVASAGARWASAAAARSRGVKAQHEGGDGQDAGQQPQTPQAPARHRIQPVRFAAFVGDLPDDALLEEMEFAGLWIGLLFDGGTEQRMQIGMPLLDAPRDGPEIGLPKPGEDFGDDEDAQDEEDRKELLVRNGHLSGENDDCDKKKRQKAAYLPMQPTQCT